ncbi:MAG: hypothetical protein J0H09_01475, partial [Burkholderiales bacterium]|nr:hypothetical protein [Burkholderiales bacterium]
MSIENVYAINGNSSVAIRLPADAIDSVKRAGEFRMQISRKTADKICGFARGPKRILSDGGPIGVRCEQ